MSMLTEVAGHLVTQAVCTAIGTDLFILEIPESPDLMTSIFQYSGQPPDLTFDGAEGDRPGLQVRTRSAENDIGAGEARAAAAQTALQAVVNTTIGSTKYRMIMALGSPIFLGYDDQERPEWSQNFSVVKDP